MNEWESFYVIVGGAAAALMGLQFVVLTLIAERPHLSAPEAGAAFATPTVVHFASALLIAAIVRAPWYGMAPLAALWGVIGVAGICYSFIVARRMRTQQTYRPDLEDHLFHFALPLLAYAVIALSAIAVFWRAREALFGIGGAALLLLFIGIHNAWDAVSYHVFVSRREKE